MKDSKPEGVKLIMHDLKVALISHEFPPFTIGGIASHCYDLAYSLSKKGIETRVLCGTTAKSEKTIRLDPFLEVIRLPCLNFPPRYLWFQLFNHKKLCSLTSDCDIIHGVNPTASLALASHQKNSGKALITTHHLNELQTLKTYLLMPFSELSLGDLAINVFPYPLNEFIERMWFKYADRIVVPGYSTYEFMKRIYKRKYVEKISVVYNGINFEKIEALASNSQVADESNLSIVCFSRLVSHKGVAQFLSRSKPLFSDFPSVHMKIFGNGPLYSVLMKIIRKNNMVKNVSLMGHVPYEELIGHVSKAAVAVFPTFLEVGPFISALEAMACKKPIVVFDLPFNREFIRHMKNGVMAKAGDMIDMISKIELLLSDKDLRVKIGENAYKYVKEHHNWDTLVNKYIEIYDQALHS